jgi:ubiquitin C-terminal hydrolase
MKRAELLKLLRGRPSDYILCYILQILRENEDGFVELIGDIDFLEGVVASLPAFIHSMPYICWFILTHFQEARETLPDLDARLIPFIMNSLSRISEMKVKRVDALTALLMRFIQHGANIIRDYQEQLVQAITTADDLTWDSLSKCLTACSSPQQRADLAQICLSHLELPSPYFAVLLSQIFGEWAGKTDPRTGDLIVQASQTATGRKLQAMIDMLLVLGRTVRFAEKCARTLIEHAFLRSTGHYQQFIFRALEQVAGSPKAAVVHWLREQMPEDFECWNYAPSDHVKVFGVVGLRNLAVTCYVNAILQQLFNTPPFLAQIFGPPVDGESVGMQPLRMILGGLLRSNENVIDPATFIEGWRGVGNIQINTREQQDAQEFYSQLMETVPFKTVFEGTTRSVVEGSDGVYHSETEDVFLSFQVSIEGQTDLVGALASYREWQSLVGDNQIKVNGIAIDARKSQRLLRPPVVFVVHLNRFRFGVTQLKRVKLHDRFQYPERFNARCLLDVEQDLSYQLMGIVCHRGDGDHGHYISIVRRGDDWLKMNDSEVSPFTRFDDTFGGVPYGDTDVEAVGEATLLFYSQDTATKVDLFGLLAQNHPGVDTVLTHQNERFSKKQLLMDYETFRFCMNLNDLELLTDYFFFIFTRTNLANHAKAICEYLERGLVGQRADRTIKRVVEHWTKIEALWVHGHPTIIESCRQLLLQLITRVDPATTCLLLDSIVRTLVANSSVTWMGALTLLRIMNAAVAGDRNPVGPLAVRLGINNKLIQFTVMYVSSKSVNWFAEKDFSVLFGTLHWFLLWNEQKEDYRAIDQIADWFMKAGPSQAQFTQFYSAVREKFPA